MKGLLLILLSMFLVVSCNKKTSNKEKTKDNTVKNVKKFKTVKKEFKVDTKSILLQLPKETQAIVNLKSIESIFNNFMVAETSIFGIPFPQRDFKEIKNFLSFNPASLKDLEGLGIDTKKELGLAFSDAVWGKYDNFEETNIILYLPVKDSKKLLSFIESKFENGKWKADESANVNIKKEKDYMKIFGKSAEESLYIFVKNDYFFLVMNPKSPQTSLNLTKSILKGESLLKDNKTFKESLKLNKTDSGIYLYGDIESFIESNRVKIEKEFKNSDPKNQLMDLFKLYKTASMSLSLDTKDFILDFSVLLNKSSEALSIFKGIKYDNSTILGLDKPVFALMSFGINVAEYFKVLSNLLGDELDKELDRSSKELAIDIRKDLINNFNGNFAFASYDGMGISTTNYNSVVTIGFKDAKLISNLIEKLLANPKLKEGAKFVNKTKEDGKDIYIINAVVTQVYIGFNKNELVIASSKDMFKSA